MTWERGRAERERRERAMQEQYIREGGKRGILSEPFEPEPSEVAKWLAAQGAALAKVERKVHYSDGTSRTIKERGPVTHTAQA